jgi:plasmid stability protein
MASLMIRDLPPKLLERLKERAKVNRRSLGKEALVILEQALGMSGWPPNIEELDNLRIRGSKPLTQDLLDEARESGRP